MTPFCGGILGDAGSGGEMSTSAGGVFIFLPSPELFLTRPALDFLDASSDRRGMISGKQGNNWLGFENYQALNKAVRHAKV